MIVLAKTMKAKKNIRNTSIETVTTASVTQKQLIRNILVHIEQKCESKLKFVYLQL